MFNACTVSAEATDEYAVGLSNDRITVNGAEAPRTAGAAVYVSDNTVINITKAGSYRITGAIDDGQIKVNAGNGDSVTLILDGAVINRQTSPAILVKNAYDPKTAGDAGVRILLADESENNVSGTGDGDNDGAISSDISLIIDGGGMLKVRSGNEGIETNIHLTINSGNVIINSADDAINGSEDGVSHIMINGGNVYAAPPWEPKAMV